MLFRSTTLPQTVVNNAGFYSGNSSITGSPVILIQSNTGTATLSLVTGTGGGANTIITSGAVSVTNSTSNVRITPASVIVANATVNVFTANTTGIRWVPNTYSFGSVNAAGNGYAFMPGGVMMQWGTVLSNTSVGNVTFSTNTGSAFPTNIWSVHATANTAGPNVTAGVWAAVVQANTTQISIRTANSTAELVYWMAIGN